MNGFSKKFFFIVWIPILFFAQQVLGQEGCYDCNLDSLTQIYQNTTGEPEKIKLLSLLIDLRLNHIHIHDVNENSLNDDSTSAYIKFLIEESNKQKVNDIDAYRSILDAFDFFHSNKYLVGQRALIKAITLFDKSHKKIPRLLMFNRLTYNFAGNQEDRLKYYTNKLQYYLTYGPVENTAPCFHAIAGYYYYQADYNLAISNYLKAGSVYSRFDNRNYLNDLGVVAQVYASWGNYKKAAEYMNAAIPLNKLAKDSFNLTVLYLGRSRMYRALRQFKDANAAADTSFLVNNGSVKDMTGYSYLEKALAYIGLRQLNDAWSNLTTAKKIADTLGIQVFGAHGAFELDFGFYEYFSLLKDFKKAEQYLLSAYEKSIEAKSNELQLKYLRELSLFYGEQKNTSSANEYTKKFFALTDELEQQHASFKVAQYENEAKELEQNDSINVLKQKGAIQSATIKKNNTILGGSLVALLLITLSLFFVYRQYRVNRKTLLSLRKTQRQLILAEKMASLGELTAGIAHEIQNPLNFVNNFSEVNAELIDELVQEKSKAISERDEKLEGDLLSDIKQNLEKILHHGKRADAIVKGMLQHSRSSSNEKEPANINALADEYFRLSYHGLRARNKSFNATLQTNFDESISLVNIVPQDIGRVLLNLYNNAFYAVADKAKTCRQSQGNAAYEPSVTVTTQSVKSPSGGLGVSITVKDNGNGIPPAVVDKIFHPFFTTKPTGEGTGLGLSLSYDIIKAHGGEIKVTTKEGAGSEFVIQLFGEDKK